MEAILGLTMLLIVHLLYLWETLLEAVHGLRLASSTPAHPRSAVKDLGIHVLLPSALMGPKPPAMVQATPRLATAASLAWECHRPAASRGRSS